MPVRLAASVPQAMNATGALIFTSNATSPSLSVGADKCFRKKMARGLVKLAKSEIGSWSSGLERYHEDEDGQQEHGHWVVIHQPGDERRRGEQRADGQQAHRADSDQDHGDRSEEAVHSHGRS